VKEIFKKSGKLERARRSRLLSLRIILLNLSKKFIKKIEEWK
jgi:hypothetical protein